MLVGTQDKTVWQNGSIFHNQTLKLMLQMRNLGYLHNPGSQSSMSKMSNQTTPFVKVKQEVVQATYRKVQQPDAVGGITSQPGLAQ